MVQPRLARKLDSHVMGLLQPSLLYTGLILAALGFLGRRLATELRGKLRATAAFALAAVIVPVLVLRWYSPLEWVASAHSSRRLAATILSSPYRGAPIYGYYYYRNSLPFYLRRPVGLLSVEWGEMTSNYQVAHQARARRTLGGEAGKGVLVTLPEFKRLAKANAQPLLVMVPNPLVKDLWGNVGHIDPLWSVGDYSVWEIPPAKAGVPTTEVPQTNTTSRP
jgi:hypothetical protein